MSYRHPHRLVAGRTGACGQSTWPADRRPDPDPLGRCSRALLHAGATALNVVTLGPALLISGLVLKGQGQKALTEAAEHRTAIAVAIAELDRTDALLTAVDERVEELESLLRAVTAKRSPRSISSSPNRSTRKHTHPGSSRP